MQVDWKKVEDGVAGAAEIDAEKRSAWIDDFSAGDDELKREILSLLRFETGSDGFLEQPIAGHAAAVLDSNGPDGRVFGNYKIIREIGHGGMGAVYLAERTDGEFEQLVALKIVRGSIADSRLTERFRQERQILASLNHPNIARLLDGGVSSSGEPFLAMEYIDGEPITDFVTKSRLTVEEILRLFIKVCLAISYAHRNLIVHRDIKPGNILVTTDGEPKLLDFGLAKLIDETPSEQTETLFRALTPAYASPEQFRNEPITTASDTYSLGVLLYELLTGRRPFDFTNDPLRKIIETISTREPPPPSAVATGNLNESETTWHPGDQKILKGDLDNIILMALRKEPEKRYASVGEFADDIDRYLRGIPIAARPHTAGYRMGKFIARHRYGVAAATLIIIALLAGLGASIYQSRRAEREKNKAEAVNTFLQDMLNASNPRSDKFRAGGRETTVKELLDQAAATLESGAAADPAVVAELHQIIGISYYSSGQYELGEKHLTKALDLQRALYGENSPQALKTLVALSDRWSMRGRNAASLEFYSKNIDSLRYGYRSRAIPAADYFGALYTYSVLVRASGKSSEAETIIREAISLDFGPSSSEIGEGETILALTLLDQGKLDEAEEISRRMVDRTLSSSNSESTSLASGLTILGSVLMEKGLYSEAEAALSEANQVYRKAFEPNYMPIGDNLRIQAQNLYLQGRYDEAINKIDQTLTIYRQSTTAYVNYPMALQIKGLSLSKNGDIAAGEQLLREALKIRLENLPREHFLTSLAQSALGECLTLARKYDEADGLLKESLTNLTASQGPENPRTKLAESRLLAFNTAHSTR